MVPEKEITSVRIKFTKTNDLMYISHLDLTRTMQRIILRSGIDIWYSEGFNPQPKMVFALPLPIGVESVCELLDIKLNHPMEFDEIKERIQRNFPVDMKVLDVYTPDVKFKNIAFADYTIKLYSSNVDEMLAQAINKLFSSECIITKRSKSGEKEVDICDYINSIEASLKDGYIEVRTVICADSEKNLNPELIVEAIKKYTNLNDLCAVNDYHTIMRNKLLDGELNEFK